MTGVDAMTATHNNIHEMCNWEHSTRKKSFQLFHITHWCK